MSARVLIILLVVTIAAVAGAVLVSSSGSSAPTEDVPSAVFPGLSDKLENLARIEIRKGGDSLTIEETGEGWGLADKGGYPVRFEKVRDLALGIAELEPLERKTANPELHERIGLEGPAEGSESTLVVFKDASGAELASLIVGSREFRGANQKWYVRKSGEEQTWLAEGRLDLQTSLATWTDRDIVRLPRDRIESVMITHPDGETLLIYREAESDRNFLVEGVPEGRELTTEAAANPIGAALAFLSFQDVASEAESDVDFSRATIAEYITWDGLTVTVRTVEEDGEWWITIDADAPAAPPVEDDAEPASAEPAGPAAEADQINEKTLGWVFQVQQGKGANFTKRPEDLLKPLPDNEPSGPPTQDAGPPSPDGG